MGVWEEKYVVVKGDAPELVEKFEAAKAKEKGI